MSTDAVFTAEQRDLRDMLDALAARRPSAAAGLDDSRPDEVSAVAEGLAGLGVWTLGTDEAAGGGGADDATTAVALERLGRHWPALGWAAAQAHAAVDVLVGHEALLDAVHGRAVAVAVVDAASPSVRLSWRDARLVGSVARVDAAHPAPHLLLLTENDAVLVRPDALTATPRRRTGLGGALTRSLEVDVPRRSVERLRGVATGAARRRLQRGAAAVAIGLAGAAADCAVAYARQRHQFGEPLTAIATVRASLLDQVGRTVVLRAALGGGGDEVSAAALARAATTAAVDICAAAVQAHGGYGYLAEYPVERRLRDAVSLRAAADVESTAVAAGRRVAGQEPEPSPLELIEEAS